MTQTKTAALTTIKATAKTHSLPADFTIDAPKRAADRIVAASLMAGIGWRSAYASMATSSRVLRRLKRKAERTGRKLQAHEVGVNYEHS